MIGEPWFYGAMLALIGLQIMTVVIAYYRGEGPFAPSATDSPDPAAPGGIRCPDCGAENAVDYRFCRQCVTELPESMDGKPSPVSTLGRRSP